MKEHSELRKLKGLASTGLRDLRESAESGADPVVVRKIGEEYRVNVLDGSEKELWDCFFRAFKDENKVVKAVDLVLLSMLCYDLVRLVRVQRRLTEESDFVRVSTKAGLSTTTVSQLGYYLNQLEGQIRKNMSQLGLTMGDKARAQAQALSGTDFSKLLSEVED